MILDATVFLLSGILEASVNVTEFLNDFTASIKHSFTNSPSVNGLEFLAIRCDIEYEAVSAFAKGVALSVPKFIL